MSAPDPTARTLFAGRPLAPSRPARGEHPFVFTSDWPHDAFARRARTMLAERDGLEVTRAVIAAGLDDNPAAGRLCRAVWRRLRVAVRGCDWPAVDRLEWRGRSHRVHTGFAWFTWPGGQAYQPIARPSADQVRRCLLMGRAHPIAGPVGRLP